MAVSSGPAQPVGREDGNADRFLNRELSWLDFNARVLALAEDSTRLLLERGGVAVLPCDGFGPSAAGHLRIALSAPEPRLKEAGDRIVRFAHALAGRNER